ncbi:thioredoxin domain-containing protein [Sulfurimonas sp.]|uniref:thioredoxin domain-containing protein n=1 Tax=Sulfurimonas sp. TaxID=2022749 RepID=UPI003566FAEA
MANRLELEDSPYLQQHKNNPVNWYPWCDEAFERAKKENKAIFISIGYSSCHWCHVMEENVFENKECADILNEHFISIKVDREERPDLDKHYQEVYQLLNRRGGGWPTSIFATPQNKPFFAGTYIPAESRGDSIQGMGFIDLTSLIAQKIEENDSKLFENADEIEGFINNYEHPKEATVLKEDFYKNYIHQVKNNYEPKFGGFSQSPKFPQINTLNTLLSIDKLYDDKAARAMLLDTLANMSKGGMYDLVDGGYCRYSVDEKWLVPHFEKMLYDNALLCELYAKTYLHYKDDKHLRIAKEIADFWLNFMSDDSLFYSASDADSEGNEGSYFVYEYDEVKNALVENGFENVEVILDKLSITKNGNFEGKNIIRIEKDAPENFDDIKLVLKNLRKTREYPFCDKKVQTSWSAMMIKALFILGSIDSKYNKIAVDSLNTLLKTIYIDDKLYHTTLIGKEPKVEAFLEDYAFLSDAILTAYKYTGKDIYIIQAQRFINIALEKFYKTGVWNFSDKDFEVKAEIYDNTYTSSVAVILDAMFSLSMLIDDEKYAHFAFKTLEYNSYELARRPVLYPKMLEQVLRYVKGDRVIKSNQDNLNSNIFELSSIQYPFTLLKSDLSEEFLVCGDKSCYASTKNIKDLNKLIINSI